MKKTRLMYWILAMLLVVSLVMVGCAGNEAPEATTEVVMAATEAAPTEPAETKPAFVPERYEPTLPPEPTVPETEPTEPATEPVEEDEDDYYYEDDSSSGSDYTPAPEAPAETTPPAPEAPAETAPPATEAPAPVETTPPETEAPAPALNYAAAGNYGDSYAASTYGWIIDYSLNSETAGYNFPSSRSLDYYLNNGGQAALNAEVEAVVDTTAYYLGGDVYGVSCCVWESGGTVYVVVYYG